MKNQTITLNRDVGELGQELEITFVVRFYPGSPETGCFGPVERYDPGSADEVVIASATTLIKNTPFDLTALYLNALPDDLLDDLCEHCRAADSDAARHADDVIKARKEDARTERLAA